MSVRKPWPLGLLALAVVVYAVMWLGWATPWTWVVALDDGALESLHRVCVAHPWWLTFWQTFCTVFGPLGFRIIALLPIGLAVARKQWRVALFLFFCVELSGVVTEIAKALADRPRPATAFVVAPSTSFPSGHALCAMAGVLGLYTVARLVKQPALRTGQRRWAIAIGAVVVVAVGFGRVVLNVHNPSDVIAGWALGYAYFLLCATVLLRRPVRVAGETPAALGSAP
jgi:membrane-associated phospholipid phosphatase